MSYAEQQIIDNVIATTNQLSLVIEQVKEMFRGATYDYTRPCVLFKPTLVQDGSAWLAILGDLPTGVVGCGDTPSEAMIDFDRAWYTKAKVPPKKDTD